MPKLYVDFMSQPSRACIIFCRMHSLPVEEVKVFISKGDTRSSAYRAVAPLGKVPCLVDDNGFSLPESGAIMQYLAVKYSVSHSIKPHWCPMAALAAGSTAAAAATAAFGGAQGALQQGALVEAATQWYHTTIRPGCARQVWNLVLAPAANLPSNLAVAADGAETLQAALLALASVWLLASSSKPRHFMTGEEPCIADLLCACELEELSLLEFEVHGKDLESISAPHPAVAAWLQRVRMAHAPHYQEAGKALATTKVRLAQRRAQASKL